MEVFSFGAKVVEVVELVAVGLTGVELVAVDFSGVG